MSEKTELDRPLDIGIVLFYMTHIHNPCGIEHNRQKLNLRDLYLREAKKLLETYKFSNSDAKEFLEKTIEEYS